MRARGLTLMAKRREQQMFRCFYHPADRYGSPVPMPSGNLPSVDIAAVDRDEAASLAFKQLRAPITETERLDGVPVPKAPRKRALPKPKLADLGLVSAASLLRKDQS